jgi:hypothetical protein
MRSFESVFLLSYSRLRSSPSTWICAPFVGVAANSESLPRTTLRCREFANPLSLFGREVHGDLHFCEFDPSQVGRWGQIDLTQIFCPRLFRSSPMPAGYRWVPVGNARALRDKFGVCLHQRFLAFSCQFITADGVGNSHCNPFCNRRAITAVDNEQFQWFKVSDRRYADVFYSVPANTLRKAKQSQHLLAPDR